MHPNHSSTQKSPQTITNNQLEQLLAMRETQKGLRDRLKLMDDAINEAEAQLIDQMNLGANLTECGYTLSVQETVRRYPAWKEHFLWRLGKTEADAVLESTPATVHRKLVIK